MCTRRGAAAACHRVFPALSAAVLATMVAAPCAAQAERTLAPYGAVGIEYQSNVFYLDSAQRAQTLTGSTQRDDIIVRQRIGVDLRRRIGRQRLHATIEGRRYDFMQFHQLDHDELLVALGMDWQLQHLFDGALDYRQERRIASFADRNSTALSIERERIGDARIGVSITPRWRLESTLRRRELRSPLPGFPELSLTETTLSPALRYEITELMKASLVPELQTGRFDGIPESQRFEQRGLGLRLDRAVGSVTRADAQLGYTQRKQKGDAATTVSGVTGALGLHRELTAKTTIDLALYRRVASYVGDASTTREIGGSAAVKWQATPKSALSLRYERTRGRLQQADVFAEGGGRRDNNTIASTQLSYQPLPWMVVALDGGYRQRDSTRSIDRFDGYIAAFEVQLRFD